MPASHRVELVFQYERSSDHSYTGALELQDASGPQHFVFEGGDRIAWVAFVHGAVLKHAPDAASFVLTRKDRSTYRHVVDRQTLERIKSGELKLEDVVL